MKRISDMKLDLWVQPLHCAGDFVSADGGSEADGPARGSP